ncbi:MAG TPA: hypothetical protein VF774_05660 [Pseudoduganella sp.]
MSIELSAAREDVKKARASATEARQAESEWKGHAEELRGQLAALSSTGKNSDGEIMTQAVRYSYMLALSLAAGSAIGQELSTARFVGALDGAADACASAFQSDAASYRATSRRIMSCQMDDKSFAQWHLALRSDPTNKVDYQKGFVEGLDSLAPNAQTRERQCRSLLDLPCQPITPVSK